MGQKLKLDFSGVETFQRASEGVHAVKVATAEVTQSQGGNDMIAVAFEITKGNDKGARVYENFPLVDKALWKLKGFLQAIGMKADGKVQIDVDKLVGKVCQINVIHEEYEGKLRARCESIMKLAVDADEDDDDEDFDDEDEAADDEDTAEESDEDEAEEEEPKKPAKKETKKPAKKAAPKDEEDDDDDEDWDEEDDEEPEEEEKPKKPAKKAPKKEEKPKKDDKKSKKSKSDDDDDWDDDDDDWDE